MSDETNVVHFYPATLAARRGQINPATIAESCRELVLRSSHTLIDWAKESKVRVPLEVFGDLAQACELLAALRDRAAEGRILDLEQAGIYDDVFPDGPPTLEPHDD